MPKLGVSIQGLRNPGEPHPTRLFRRDAFDEIVEISQEEMPAILEVSRRLAKEEGLFVGLSAGAVMRVALTKEREAGRGKTVVAVLPDSGSKYLSTPLFE
jgi:cysteine synthase